MCNEAVSDYLDTMTNVVSEIVCDIQNGHIDDAVAGLHILVAPSRECVHTVEREYRRILK